MYLFKITKPRKTVLYLICKNFTTMSRTLTLNANVNEEKVIAELVQAFEVGTAICEAILLI